MLGLTGFRSSVIKLLSTGLIVTASVIVSAQDPIKIMPLGNSITRGSMCLNGHISSCSLNSDGNAIGYRYRLYNLLTAAGYSFDFVGKKNYGYNIFSDSQNSGFDGIRSSSLADVMETGTSTFTGLVTSGPYLNYYPADIILLHIGTNDVLAGYTSVSDVSRILDAIDTYENISGHPVIVFLAKIISEKNYSCNTHPGTIAFNENLISMAQTRISNGDHIVLIDMECNAGLNYTTDLVDEVHPDADGYTKMGDTWFQAINNFNSAPLVSAIPEQITQRGTPFTNVILDNYVYDVENLPSEMIWSFTPSSPQHFNIIIDSNREVNVTPIDPYWSGSEIVQFKATDRGKILTALKKSASTTVTFTVDWMPQILDQAELTTMEEGPLTISPNDLTIVEPEKAPPGITLTVNPGDDYSVDGTTITPATDFNGTLTVPVTISVDGKTSDVFDLQVEVTAVNDPPAIVSQNSITTDRNVPVVISLEDITFTDPDNPQENHVLHLLPGQDYAVNGYTITPALNYYGELEVNAELSDPLVSVPFTLNVTVNYLNISPTFLSVPVTEATEALPYTYVATARDVDVEDPNVAQTLTFWADTIPGWLAFHTDSKILVGFPQNEDVGEYMIRLAVTDGIDTVYQEFNLTVNNVNNPPFILGQQSQISGIVNTYTVLNISELIIDDPDNSPEEMHILAMPGMNYTVSGDTIFFAHGYTGFLTIGLKVNDGTDDSNVYNLKVQVDFGEGLPVVSNELLSRVYPNPADDYVIFETRTTGDVLLEIRDISGKVLIVSKMDGYPGKFRIDVSRFSKGIYIYKIYNEGQYQVGKLIIN